MEEYRDGDRIRLYVSGEFRWIPARWWYEMEGPRPPYLFENDGCTASPDYARDGSILWPACIIHDWHYRHGPSFRISRRQADAYFRRNLNRLLALQGVSWWRRLWYSWSRWLGVRKLGESHYGRKVEKEINVL